MINSFPQQIYDEFEVFTRKNSIFEYLPEARFILVKIKKYLLLEILD